MVPSRFSGIPKIMIPDSTDDDPAKVAYPASEKAKIVANPDKTRSLPLRDSDKG